jgi:hypothetical protein
LSNDDAGFNYSSTPGSAAQRRGYRSPMASLNRARRYRCRIYSHDDNLFGSMQRNYAALQAISGGGGGGGMGGGIGGYGGGMQGSPYVYGGGYGNQQFNAGMNGPYGGAGSYGGQMNNNTLMNMQMQGMRGNMGGFGGMGGGIGGLVGGIGGLAGGMNAMALGGALSSPYATVGVGGVDRPIAIGGFPTNGGVGGVAMQPLVAGRFNHIQSRSLL